MFTRVKFPEEYVVSIEKYVLLKESLQIWWIWNYHYEFELNTILREERQWVSDFKISSKRIVQFFNMKRYIIIIIMSCRQHGYPWPSLATSPYYSLPQAGLQGYILCPHIAAVWMFELVVLLLLGHMWGSIGVHHLWARPCFSSSVLRVWFV